MFTFFYAQEFTFDGADYPDIARHSLFNLCSTILNKLAFNRSMLFGTLV